MTVKGKVTRKVKFIAMLEALAMEVEAVGLGEMDIEDGEMAYILNKCANLIGLSNVPDNLWEK